MGPAHCCFGKGLLPERSVNVKEAQGTKTTQVNTHMATADHDRQEQAAHKQCKSQISLLLAAQYALRTQDMQLFSDYEDTISKNPLLAS